LVPRFQRTLPIMNSLNKRVTAVSLVIVLLAVFTISSAGSMVADIVSYRAKLQEHFWSSAEPISSVEEWDDPWLPFVSKGARRKTLLGCWLE